MSKEKPNFTITEKSSGNTRLIELHYGIRDSKTRKSGDNKSVNIERILESISTGLMMDKEKPRRDRSQFPDPEKKRYDDINRLDKHFQSRIDEETDKNIRDFLKATGMTKKEATQRAFTLLMELYDYE